MAKSKKNVGAGGAITATATSTACATTTRAGSPARPTLEQVRAKAAWELIAKVKASDLRDSQKDEFGTEVKRMAARVIACGLGQALAFVRAKAKDKKPALRELVGALDRFIAERIPRSGNEPPDLLGRIVHRDAAFLRRSTAEVLALLPWIGRLAEAEGFVGEVGEADDD